jgi:hypothetical protein
MVILKDQLAQDEAFQEFNVDKAQVMRNLRDHYTIPLEEAVIVENMDNCIDEPGYNKVEFELKNEFFIIKMSGTGIPKGVFDNLLHTLAGTTKTEKPGLGHYGWGMKVGLAISTFMQIKTRNGKFCGGQEWKLDENEIPRWRNIPEPDFKEDMTIIEHKLKPEIREVFSTTKLKSALQKYYPTVIGGAPANGRIIELLVNGKQIESIRPPFDKKKNIKIKIGNKEATGMMFFSKRGYKEDFDKIKIIVFGRKILDETFGVPTNNKISGYIHADMLSKIVAGDKTAVQRSQPLWTNFRKEVGKILSEFLRELGELKDEIALDSDLLKHLHEEINRTLKHFPDLFGEFKAVTNKIYKRILIPDPEGEVSSTLLAGGQETTGTFGGPGQGGGIQVEGGKTDEDAPYEIEGITPATPKIRRIRVGVQIKYRGLPGINREATFDFANATVWINSEFPTYKKAFEQNKKVFEYHNIRCIFDALLEYVVSTKGTSNVKDFLDFRADILSKWCEV